MVETKPPLALVTGAAHRLGRAFALHLARMGYAILLHHNSAEKEALDAVTEISSLGMPVYPFKADLTVTTEIDSLFSFLDTLPNKLLILVNSAAVMRRVNILDLDETEWDGTLSLNLKAPFFMAQRAVLRMKERGLIVNITDSGVGKAWTGFPAYIVSKAALETLTRVQAKALAPGIRVNAIAPGLVLPAAGLSGEEWQKLVGRLPLKRSTTPAEVASALEFLIHNETITGQTIVVDSGYSLI